MNQQDQLLRNHMKEMFGFAAHVDFDRAVSDFPIDRAGRRVEPVPHTMWMLVEHLRIVNRDLIDWVEAEEYARKDFPAGYWPESDGPASKDEWQDSLDAVRRDMEQMKAWADVPALFEPLARKKEHTRAREILLAIAHNGYHIGQMVDLRMLLGCPVKDY